MDFFLSNLVYALILWNPDLRLLMGKFRQFMTELSAYHTIYYPFMFLIEIFPVYMYVSITVHVCFSRTTWMNEYHMRRNFTNPMHIEALLAQALK